MKLSINRNTLWCDLFVQRLSQLGVKYACISPGSRSTPLTLAFAGNDQIETFPIVDERSSSFFALGLSKSSNTPVAIVTTSGTAVAELYPAIIEAFYQRIPLIICTADRPNNLRGSGANQTINQHNIYGNHIRFFADAGLPNLKNITSINLLAERAVSISLFENKGPVHINFPFEKPFEPKSYTDKIEINKIDKLFSKSSFSIIPAKESKINYNQLSQKFSKKKQGLILAGYNNYSKDFAQLLVKFSNNYGYPVYADGSSSLRFGPHSKKNIVDNFTAIVRAKNFMENYDPEIIIQFGGAPTSNVLLDFFKSSKAEKYIINEYGDRNDPSLTAKNILTVSPEGFCSTMILKAQAIKVKRDRWLEDFQKMNKASAEVKKQFIANTDFPFEGRIISEIVNAIPSNSNLMISNSLPIRDTDFFTSASDKRIKIFANRGASGIDGINSTALGIAKASKNPTYLLTGDLAFFHDMNGLINSKKFKIPLIIILIDNSGGGIFESLPISAYREFMEESFLTPLNLDFGTFVAAYGGKLKEIKNWRDFHRKLLSSTGNKTLTVFYLKTNAVNSKLLRQNYWSRAAQEIDKCINEFRNRRHKI
jgi:2-succinyl-5-enolpyruvyl-6-hydroxy-3-cyclohexene-1-carboxylate synthase